MLRLPQRRGQIAKSERQTDVGRPGKDGKRRPVGKNSSDPESAGKRLHAAGKIPGKNAGEETDG